MFVFAGQFIGNEWFYNECRYQLTTILRSLIKKTEATSSSSSHRIPEHATKVPITGKKQERKNARKNDKI